MLNRRIPLPLPLAQRVAGESLQIRQYELSMYQYGNYLTIGRTPLLENGSMQYLYDFDCSMHTALQPTCRARRGAPPSGGPPPTNPWDARFIAIASSGEAGVQRVEQRVRAHELEVVAQVVHQVADRKSTRLNSSHEW